MRLRTIVVSGALLTLAGLLTGCGAGSSSAGNVTGNATSSAGTPTSAAAPATTSTVVGGVDAAGSTGSAGGSSSVAAASFTADLTIQKAGLGLLALTNSGTRSVTVQGWPTPSFLNAANEPVSVPVSKVSVPVPVPSSRSRLAGPFSPG